MYKLLREPHVPAGTRRAAINRSLPISHACLRNGIDEWVHPAQNGDMNARLTLDSAGRVVIPKGLREELHLQPGDELDLETAGEQITLRPVRETPQP